MSCSFSVLSGRLLGLILASALLALPWLEAEAQARAGVGRASLTIPVQFTIRSRLSMTPSSPPEVVARTPAGVEMEFAFVVASNVDWAVTVALPGATEAAEAPAVRNDLGVWTVLESGREVRVIGRSAPSNGTLIRVRVRLPEGASTGLSDVIRFSIEPADGLPGE